jgi:uncharacterized repeat protein (TIGR01451 family)
VTVSAVTVSDPLPGLSAITCDWAGSSDEWTPAGTLSPGETVSCTATYTLTQADIDAGQVVNTATGSPLSGPAVSDSDTHSERLRQEPLIDLDKAFTSNADEDNSGSVTPGDTLTYAFTVTNVGNVTLHNVRLDDPLTGGMVTLSTTVLAPNQQTMGTATYVVTAQDVNSGSITNVATAIGIPPGGQDPEDAVSDTDQAVVFVTGVIVIGNDKGVDSKPLVTVIDQNTNQIAAQFLAYEETFAGGVRIAIGDVNNDGVDDIITAPGLGREAEVRVFSQPDPSDLTTWMELTDFRFFPYAAPYNGGIEIAVGDFDNDGNADDIVTTPSFGAVETKVFQNRFETMPGTPINPTPIRQFFAFAPSFSGGSVVAAADMNSGGPDEVIVGNGPGMRSEVRVYDISGTPTVEKTVNPFDESFLGGVSIDVSRVNADATPDLIVGAGYVNGSKVQVYDGDTGSLLLEFRAFTGSSENSPVRIAFRDTDNDGIAEQILAVQGPDGAVNEIRAFDLVFGSGGDLDAILDPAASVDLDALGDDELLGAYFL